MSQLGSFALLLALALSAYCFLAGAFALVRPGPGSDRISETARRAGIATFAIVFLAALVLVIAAFQNDFSIAYIFHHSNRDLPAPYKFATLWSGQEGSLLFWSLLLAAYGLVLRLRHKTDARLFAYASVIIAAVQVFFLLLLNFAAPPFANHDRASLPPDGSGLNPLLQYPEMVIHPPMLYLGYVGFTVPFAFALGALIMRYPGEKWIHITRRWTMVTWGFLTCGVFLGDALGLLRAGLGRLLGMGPGGERLSHAMADGHRVPAFGHDAGEARHAEGVEHVVDFRDIPAFDFRHLPHPQRRGQLGPCVRAIFHRQLVCRCSWPSPSPFASTSIVKNRSHLRSEHKLESLVSRESSFLFNNLLLLVACFTVLWGTLFPILSEWVQGHKVTVGPPFFNRVNIPVALLLLLLTAVGPLLAWRRTSLESIKRNFMWPTVGALLLGIVLVAFGLRPWQDSSYLYSLVTIMLSALVAFTVIMEFVRGGRVISRHTGQNLLASMAQLGHRNTRRYGGYIVHFGVVVVMIGFAGSAFNMDTEQEMGLRRQDGHRPLHPGLPLLHAGRQARTMAVSGRSSTCSRAARQIDTMYPERRFYKASQQPATMVANRSTLKEDLYLVYEGENLDTGRPIIKAHLNPLVAWIWIGVWIMIAGTILALFPNVAPVRVTAPARVEAEPVGAGD